MGEGIARVCLQAGLDVRLHDVDSPRVARIVRDIFRDESGRVVAHLVRRFGDISLAEGFVEDDTLECWAHGSRFELTTGKPLTLPAYEPVPVFAVEIRDGDVYIDPSATLAV